MKKVYENVNLQKQGIYAENNDLSGFICGQIKLMVKGILVPSPPPRGKGGGPLRGGLLRGCDRLKNETYGLSFCWELKKTNYQPEILYI
jgi:hypothetical protein